MDPILDEEEEEEEKEGEPEPMEVESDEEEPEEEQPPQKDKDELMSKEQFIKFVCDECRADDIPFFLLFPSGPPGFLGNVVKGTVNAIFIKMLRYFQAHRGTGVHEPDVVTLLFYLHKGEAFRVSKPPSNVQPGRMDRLKAECESFVTNFTAENFFVAFMDENRIVVYTGSAGAPYYPAFHLFYRIYKALKNNGAGKFDKSLIRPAHFALDGMKEVMDAWNEAKAGPSGETAFFAAWATFDTAK